MLLKLFVLYLIWGMNWVVMKSANEYFDPECFVMLRFTLGAMLLMLLCVPGKRYLPGRSYIHWFFIGGILQMAVHNMLLQHAMKELGSGITAVVDYSMPLWVNIIAAVVLGERLTLRKIAGISLSIAGLIVLLNAGLEGRPYAFALTLCSSLSWAVANVIAKAKLKGCDTLQSTAWQMTGAAVFLIAYVLLTGKTHAVWSTASAGILLYNVVLASAFGFLLWNSILNDMEAGQASVAVMAVPVVGVIGGVIFLHETLNASRVAGMAAVIGGILIVLTRKKKPS